jgi:hypothetical protein
LLPGISERLTLKNAALSLLIGVWWSGSPCRYPVTRTFGSFLTWMGGTGNYISIEHVSLRCFIRNLIPRLTHYALRPLYFAVAALAFTAATPKASDAATLTTQAIANPIDLGLCNVVVAGSPASCAATFQEGVWVGQAGAAAAVDNNGNMHAAAVVVEYSQDQSALPLGLVTTGIASAHWSENIFVNSSSQVSQPVTATATLNFTENFGSMGALYLSSAETGAQQRCSMVSTGTCTVSVLGGSVQGFVLVEDMYAEADAPANGLANGVGSQAEGIAFISAFQLSPGFGYTTGGGEQLGGPGLLLSLPPIPEPSSWLLMLSGLVTMGRILLRRTRPVESVR